MTSGEIVLVLAADSEFLLVAEAIRRNDKSSFLSVEIRVNPWLQLRGFPGYCQNLSVVFPS